MKLNLQNCFIEQLPGVEAAPFEQRHTPDVLYAITPPTPVARPEVLVWSHEVGAMLGLAHPVDPFGQEARVFAGNELLEGMRPYSTRYGGYQFGQWAGQLGDGRAIILGEVKVSPEANPYEAHRLEVQLKGAGLTPYSRQGDGRAVLRSSLKLWPT